MALGRFHLSYISVLYTCDEVNKIKVLAHKSVSHFFAFIQYSTLFLIYNHKNKIKIELIIIK